jgi:hypothetical protein
MCGYRLPIHEELMQIREKKYLKNKNSFFAISFSTFSYANVGLVCGQIHCTKVPQVSTCWLF